MSAEPGYMLIRVDLQGARQAAGEAAALRGSIQGVSGATAAANAQALASGRSASRMSRAWSTAGKIVKWGALGIAAGVGILAAAGVAAVKSMEELGLTAAGLRRNLGLTAEQGSRWAAIAKARDIAPTSLNMAFKTLSTNIAGAAEGGKEQIEVLKQIGMTQKDAKKGLKDFDGFVVSFAEHLGDMEGGAKRQAAASKLLGRGYQTVLPMFAEGSKGLKDQLHWADKYNVTMGDKMVDSFVDLKMAERESEVAMMGLKNLMAKEMLPIMIEAHDAFQSFAEEITDPKLTTDERVSLVSDKITKGLEIGLEAAPEIVATAASKVGQQAPKIAVAFVQGFLNANVWGKLILGAWLTKMLLSSVLLGGVTRAAGRVAMIWLAGFIARFAPGLAIRMALAFGAEAVAQRVIASSIATGAAGGAAGGAAYLAAASPYIVGIAGMIAAAWAGAKVGHKLADTMTRQDTPSKQAALDAIRAASGPAKQSLIAQYTEMFGKKPHLKLGGIVPGGYGGGDIMGIQAEPGELVLPKEVAAALGYGPRGRPLPEGKSIDWNRVGGSGSDGVWTSDVKLDGEKVGKAIHRRARKAAARE